MSARLRWGASAISSAALLAGCSLLAPNDDELLGGHRSDAGGSGGHAGTGASAGVGGGSGGTATGGKGGAASGGVGGVGATGGVGGSPTGGSGGSPTGGVGGSPTGGSGGSSTGGSAGSSTGGTGGSGGTGGNVVGSLQCGGKSCDLQTSYCCDPQIGGSAQCQLKGKSCSIGSLHCDGPEDCPGQICCGHTSKLLGNVIYDNISCQSTCAGGSERVICGSVANACVNGGTCQTSTIIPQYNDCH